jgi:hypothetical protein
VLAYPSKDARFCLISTYLAPIVDEWGTPCCGDVKMRTLWLTFVVKGSVFIGCGCQQSKENVYCDHGAWPPDKSSNSLRTLRSTPSTRSTSFK